MADATPVRLSGVTALRWAWRLARDPLVTTRHCLDAFGPFVMVTEVLPFTPPFIRSARPVLLRVPLVLSAGATFHRELLCDPATWRGVSLLPGGPKNSAARRMSLGLTRMTGTHMHIIAGCSLPRCARPASTHWRLAWLGLLKLKQ